MTLVQVFVGNFVYEDTRGIAVCLLGLGAMLSWRPVMNGFVGIFKVRLYVEVPGLCRSWSHEFLPRARA